MCLLRFNNCCWFCSLDLGTKIIFTLEIIISTALFVSSAMVCVYLKSSNYLPLIVSDDRLLLINLYISIPIISALQLIISFAALVGIITERKKYVIPWLVFGIIVILEIIAVAVVECIVFGNIVITLLAAITAIGFKIYFKFVIYNYYLEEVSADPTQERLLQVGSINYMAL